MARRLKLPGCDDPKADACELVAGWLADEENGPWLLIVDNADDANLMLGVIPSGDAPPFRRPAPIGETLS